MRILNLGAGVQSTTVYLMAHAGEIPAYDCAIFADTGEEPQAVYRHLDWLRSLGGTPILIRQAGRLGDDLIRGRNNNGANSASIPAYVRSGERIGMAPRQCTREYKIAVINRTIRRELLGLKPRQRIPAGVSVTQAYGISVDEAARSRRIRENLKRHSRWLSLEFPLLDRFMSRADCVRWLQKFGVPHPVPKSACVFCPYKSDEQWRWLKDNDPEGWARAVEIDEALRNGVVEGRGWNGQLYLHRSAVPLAEADLEKNGGSGSPQLSFALECTGMCGV
jgi:hypothetical protein